MNKYLTTASRLLSDFDSFLNSRSIVFLAVIPDVFPKILKWHFETWEKQCKYLEDDTRINEWSAYHQVEFVLDSIVRRIETRALMENQSFGFFKYFEEHVNSHEGKSVRNHTYLEAVMPTFYAVLFQTIDEIKNSRDIWAHFPPKWKITCSNLTDKKNITSRYTWYEFQRWAIRRVMGVGSGRIDQSLGETSENVFPEVDPITWSRFLIFFISNFEPHQATEIPWTFGSIGRMREAVGVPSGAKLGEELRKRDEEEDRKEREKTFELAACLFNAQLSKEKLEEYMNKLTSLRYDNDTTQERKRLSLQNLIQEMQEYLGRQKPENPI